MASTTYLQWQHTTAGNRNTWTMSMWVKLSKLGDELPLFSSASDAQNQDLAFIQADGTLRWRTYQSDAYAGQLKTNRVFRDVNAWYHLVFVFDSTNSTADDRMKIYVNGVQETSFNTRANPNQNLNSLWNGTLWRNIGHDSSGGYTDEFEGSMSHIHFIDGTAYQASTFGSTDSTTGEWKINTSPSVTYGTKGFFILKDGNSVTDQSGNSNNFTVAGGTLTKTEDNPSNVFCTMNPLSAGSNVSFANGNTYVENTAGTWNSAVGTIGVGNGKYYWEAMRISTAGECNLGVTLSSAYGGTHSEVDAGRVVYSNNGYVYREGLSGQGNTDTGTTFTGGDIIGVAIDTENGTLKFYKNGTLVNTTTDNSFLYTNNEYIPQCGIYNGGRLRFNFGNGYFADNAVSSAGTNASNNGIFEYDVPTGYTALSTKGLNL